MKLRIYPQNIGTQLWEFDNWITSSLSEIKDSKQFKSTRSQISCIIEILGENNNEFTSDLTPKSIADSIIDYIDNEQVENEADVICTFLNFLFLVTGKSDNNSKCQFPVFLKESYPNEGFPELRKVGGKIIITKGSIPRVIKAETVSKIILRMSFDSFAQENFFIKYINFILNEDDYWRSLKAIGVGYYKAKLIKHELDYLLPLVISQIRGSLSATGGHEPENILRKLMREWGLNDNIDFNMVDHIIEPIELNDNKVEVIKVKNKRKTRAYDFVLPLTADIVQHRILVQSQFYAGDSGSVSHKNIDQTNASRNYTKLSLNDVHFVEFLDGAGYYSSLNGDLRKLLQMEDTYDFIQIRTAAIKLRRILQEIGYLTPLEVAHACSLSTGNFSSIVERLTDDGYKPKEIGRVIQKSLDNGLIIKSGNDFHIRKEYYPIARRYFLLDSIAEYGEEFDNSKIISGAILIPGYSNTFGIKLNEIYESIIPNAGLFKQDWVNSSIILSDIQFLADRRWIKQC